MATGIARIARWVTCMAAVLCLSACGRPDAANERAFDKIVWMANATDGEGYSLRLGMIPDLVQNALRLGMPRGDVVALLGKPDAEVWSGMYPSPGWSVGRYPHISDGTALIVVFDSQARAEAVFAPYWYGTGRKPLRK